MHSSECCHYVFAYNIAYFLIFQIIFANVTTKDHAPVSLDGVSAPYEVAFTYSVKWYKTK